MEELKQKTAVCGIDCFNCEFYHTNIEAFFKGMTEDQKSGFASRGMTKEKMNCQGCRISGCTVLDGKCETLECVRSKYIDFCYECGDFPCSKLQPMAEGADRFPHNLKVYNLMAIRNKGIEQWASETVEIRKRYFKGKFKIGAGPQK